MKVYRRKFRHSIGFEVLVYTLLGFIIGGFFAFDKFCRIISHLGILIIIIIPMLIVVMGTSFYLIIDKNIVVIKNIAPFIQFTIHIEDVDLCKITCNYMTGIYHIAFFKKNKYAMYYPLGMVSPDDIDNITEQLMERGIVVQRKG
ncbi:MAG: hypothetical protein J6A27_06225 [Bacteroidales bacterium]|nr:hypothetical protein [Bacteroidales bacterium]